MLSARYWLRGHGTVAPPGLMSGHGSPPDWLPVSIVCWIGGFSVSSDSAGVISIISRCSVGKQMEENSFVIVSINFRITRGLCCGR